MKICRTIALPYTDIIYQEYCNVESHSAQAVLTRCPLQGSAELLVAWRIACLKACGVRQRTGCVLAAVAISESVCSVRDSVILHCMIPCRDRVLLL